MDSFKQSVAVYTVGGLGISFNFALLYLIATDKAKSGDGYRRMLAIVTAFNVYYAFVHCLSNVAFIIDEAGFLVFSKNLHKFGFWYSYVIMTIYIISFEMSLSLLGIHCFYRYAKITNKYVSIFEKWYYILLLVIIFFIVAIIYGLNCAFDMLPSPARDEMSRTELLLRYNVSIDGLGYLGPVYKLRNSETGKVDILFENMLGSLSCLIVQVIIFTIICVCGWKLYNFVRSALISEKKKAMNIQLLRLLLIQGIAPVIFDYTPAMCTIWGGFVGLPFHEVAMYIPILIAGYSPAEALMVIFGFAAYRRRILKLFPCRQSVSLRPLSETRKAHQVTNLSNISSGFQLENTKKYEEMSTSANLRQ